MKQICIIGGSGFIGTSLCKRFEQDKKIDFSIVDKKISYSFPQKTKKAHIQTIQELRKAVSDCSCIVHLAAEHRDDVHPKSLYDTVNVEGTKNVCTVAKEKKINTIIFTSSVAVYGFAPIGTNEAGAIKPFNDYGRTKHEAECILKEWQKEAPATRTLVIIRPTVVFGKNNRGNVYNLLRQIVSGKFVMIGRGVNQKSMAYVENLTAFIKYTLNFQPGVHTYNYIDKPDFTMNALVAFVYKSLKKKPKVRIRMPYGLGYSVGMFFDFIAKITNTKFSISAIRVKKFCSDSVFDTSIPETGFVPAVSLKEGLDQTIRHEFIETHQNKEVFYTE